MIVSVLQYYAKSKSKKEEIIKENYSAILKNGVIPN